MVEESKLSNIVNSCVEKCPLRKQGLQGDFDYSYSCLATGRADADDRGYGYDGCDFKGEDYRECPRLKK